MQRAAVHYLPLRHAGAALACVLAAGSAPSQAAPHDQYLSTGDNHYVGNWLPLDSAVAIDASFDMLKDVFGTRRVYWRGLQDQLLIESVARPEHVAHDRFKTHLDFLINQQGINDYAVQAAHARGMEIWGQTGLYDWGSGPDIGAYGFPSPFEHPLRSEHPQWVPVDKYGSRRQGGPLEFAYAEARTESVNWVESRLRQTGYDGVLFHTYAENFGTRFGDEFGFSDPIVSEFKDRYGVDIRYQAFNKQDWYDLRGEHTTAFLQELKSTLGADNKKIGVAINPLDTDRPQLWLDTAPFPTAGNVTLDWEAWSRDGVLDQLVVWGGTDQGPAAMNELIGGVQGTGVGLSVMTSQPDALAWEPFKQQGHGVTQWTSNDWQYILASDIPVQPLSALQDSAPYKRMRALAQVIEGSMTATAADILPLVHDPNLLNRRHALTALARIGDTQAIAALEDALHDPEASVRNAAVYGLIEANRASSITAVMQAVEEHGGFSLMEGAYQLLRQRPEWIGTLVEAVGQSENDSVRMVAMRALLHHSGLITASQVPTLVAATHDAEAEVRAFAVDLLGQIKHLNSPLIIESLVDAMQSNDTVIASRAATALSNAIQVHAPAAVARRAELIELLADEFASLGDATQRADRAWAGRPLGNALAFLGNDGRAILTDFMNQREDRRLSELAWEILYIPQRSHQASPVTEEADAYAHYKRPRWDRVLAASDDFDRLSVGASIQGQSPVSGLSWTVLSGNASDQIIQDEYARSGHALRAVRRQGGHHILRLDAYERHAEAAEITRVTARADWMRLNDTDSTVLLMGLGGFHGPGVFIDTASRYLVWQSDGTETGGSYINSGFLAGTEAWETIEIELTLDAAVQGLIAGRYDVYLARGAGGSLGAMSRTLIADDIEIFALSERALISLLISNQPNGFSDVITYWDNISLTIDPILVPEPSALSLVVLALLGGLSRAARR